MIENRILYECSDCDSKIVSDEFEFLCESCGGEDLIILLEAVVISKELKAWHGRIRPYNSEEDEKV